MFQKRTFQLFLAVFLFGAIVACSKVQPIYNTESISIIPISEEKPTLDEIRGIISRAAIAKRWTVEISEPNMIIATYARNKHTAQVNITYSLDSFTITYVNSVGLRYSDGMIHRNYNRWIRNLVQQIQTGVVNFTKN